MRRIGPYRLLRRLAVGGMAEVFKARYEGPGGPEGLAPGTVVALKRLLPTAAEEEGLAALFVAEGRLATRLDHRRVARAWAVEERPGGEPVLVLEYVPGRTLHDVMGALEERADAVPADVLAAVGLQVAEALDYVHQLRDEGGRPLAVVHRDVSPHNLMVGPDGGIKLLDFGIATFEGRGHVTRAGVLKGKHAYMSPEQASRQPLDARSDVFSLGVILWELATGARLFKAPSIPDTLERIVAVPAPPLGLVAPEVPPALAEVVGACLRRDPASRPGAGEVARHLAAWRAAAGGGSPEEAVARWLEGRVALDDEGDDDELARYDAGLRSAEDAGEETTDQRGVADATQVYATEGLDAAALRRLATQGPPAPRARARRVATWALALLVLAFTAATAAWYLGRMAG